MAEHDSTIDQDKNARSAVDAEAEVQGYASEQLVGAPVFAADGHRVGTVATVNGARYCIHSASGQDRWREVGSIAVFVAGRVLLKPYEP